MGKAIPASRLWNFSEPLAPLLEYFVRHFKIWAWSIERQGEFLDLGYEFDR